ncbi:MAG TPA: aminotransferase class V-fold PLP-dependent enzyme, partial [Spirochaetia bacterium]|nr:aminotransferase class V-fold PLP-dependent enzyme [Spirochaetia bacterium]
GTGMLFSDERLKPFRFGGTQENGLFPGTENLPGIIALAAALELLASRQLEDEQVLSSLDTDGRRILDTGGFPYIWESPREKASGVFCISLPWVADMEELLFYLNTKHVFVSRFSACTGRVDGPSRVLCAMGRPFDRATRSLRVSLGRESTRKDLFTFGSVLKEYWSRARIHL